MTQQRMESAPGAVADLAPASASRFAWHDLMTADLPRAREYYTRLFGWELREQDMGAHGVYTMIHVDGVPIGGMMQRPNDETPTHWLSYILVDDVDDTSARAVAQGAQVIVPPTDIPNVGRFAVMRDPAGAFVASLSLREPRAELDVAPPGTFSWVELLASDIEGSLRFYSSIFGWTTESMPMGDFGIYHLFKRAGDRMAGGMLKIPDGASQPPAWLPYVAVTSADASAAKVKELGGTIHVPPTDIPGVGRFAVTMDPSGGAIAILQAASG